MPPGPKLMSRLLEDDMSQLTSFNLYDANADEGDQESVLSKLLYKVRTAVSYPVPMASTSSNSATSLDSPRNSIMVEESSSSTRTTQALPRSTVSFEEAREPISARVSMDDLEDGGALTKTSSNDSDNQSVMTNFSVSNYHSLNRVIAQLRGENIKDNMDNTEYWMPDAQCKECFDCNARFKFYRRKHHCRICGQIFCGKCASDIIQGERIGQNGQVRVCKFCYSKLQAQEQQQEEHEATTPVQKELANIDPDSIVGLSPVLPDQKPPSAPKIQIPTTTLKHQGEYGGQHSTTFALEIPTEGLLPYALANSTVANNQQPQQQQQSQQQPLTENEPGMSLKGILFAPFRPRSRTNTMNSASMETALANIDAARGGSPIPFRRNSLNAQLNGFVVDGGGGTVLPCSEFDSEDEDSRKWDKSPQNLLNFLGGSDRLDDNGAPMSPTVADDDIVVTQESSKLRRRQDRLTRDRSNSMRRRRSLTITPSRSFRQRTHSLMRNTPITTMTPLTDAADDANGPSTPNVDESEPIPIEEHPSLDHCRSNSDPVNIELSTASMEHMRKILGHLLHENETVVDSSHDWEGVLMNLLLKVSDSVHPDIRGGDEIDVRHYVKIKKIAGGSPEDSYYVNGVVCSKNVAHKRMVKTIENPQVLILLFPLEWSRDAYGDCQFQSIDRVLAQEKDFLEKLVNRIVALKPSVVLVSSNVSRIALDYLVKADIAVAYNVKLSILDAVARCTGASIINSFLQLMTDGLTLGHCGVFETKTLVHDWIPHRRKTFLIFDQCPPELGATIILRGGKIEELRVIKQIMDFMVFVVHNLRLESFLLKDLAKVRNAIQAPVATATEQTTIAQSVTSDKSSDSTVIVEESTKVVSTGTIDHEECLQAVQSAIHRYQSVTLSASPMVGLPVPHLLMRLRETQKKMIALIGARAPDALKNNAPPDRLSNMIVFFRSFDQYMMGDAEYDRLLEEHHHRWRALEAYIGDNADTLSPSYHQQLVVLYMSVCSITAVPCQGPEMRLFEYYRPESDLTLGQYIEDIAADATTPCASNMCDRTMLEHYRSYAHGNAKVNVDIERVQGPAPIMSTNSILMWSYCKHCDANSLLMPMSESSWKYSFAKFLELLFHQTAEGVCGQEEAWCPHVMFRDHVHYFCIKGIAVRFQHEAIEPLEVYVPPMHLYINPKTQVALKDAALESTRCKITRFYESVIERDKNFPLDMIQPEDVDDCKEKLQEMSRRATGEKKHMLQALQSIYATTPQTDALSLNAVRIKLQMKVMQWDIEYAEFVRHYIRPERELRRHFKKMFPVESVSSSTVTNLDVRTKRTAEAPDLPILDVGLDGPGDFNALTIALNDIDTSIKCQPMLGESPTSASPWLEEETRLDNLLEEMMKEKLSRNQSRETAHSSTAQSQQSDTQSEDTATVDGIDPSVARRLSLELMKDTPKPLTTWSTDEKEHHHHHQRKRNSRHQEPQKRCSEEPEMRSQKRRVNEQKRTSFPSGLTSHAAMLPLLSSTAYKRFADILPQDSKIATSRSSPPITSKNKHKEDGSRLPPAQSRERMSDNEGSSEKRELALSGYRYGYKGSAERGSSATTHRLHPLRYYPRGRESPGSSASSLGDPKPSKLPTMDRNVKFNAPSNNRHINGRTRGVRQRLPSKSSMEVYTTIRELVREESDDEFQASDSDDSDSSEDESNNQTSRKNLTFSLTHTDEYDESWGREIIPQLGQPILHDSPVDTVPHLSFDEDEKTNDRVHHHTISDFRAIEQARGQPIPTKQNASMSNLETSTLELSTSGSERNSFLKTITNMLAEKGLGNLLPLEYPLSPLEHLFPGSLIIVGEDEPSTIVAYTLNCDDYLNMLKEIRKGGHSDVPVVSEEQSVQCEPYNEKEPSAPEPATGMFIERTLRSKSGIHMRYYFADGTTKFFCKIFFVEQFDALRRNCGCEDSYIASLASCCKWDSSGGKSGSTFLKTKDDRLLIKQISRYEMDAFLRFAPSYFQYMSEAFFHELPTVLSKIFGLYRIGFKNSTTGKSMRMDILVMENLFYERCVKKIFDLKGSMRNRHVQATGRENEVLLDENMVELMFQSPLFLRSHSKEMLRGSLHNDTLFLSRLDVMDYSLLVGVDEENRELIVGIVDFIRTFTWDKKLESWVKESGILGGGGKEPTIISPKQYRIRFREAMDRYFLMVPDFWTAKMFRRQYHHEDPPKITAVEPNL